MFTLQELKADISVSLRILCLSPLMYFKSRYSTQILMFDPFFKLIEIRYIMKLSECKYLIQTSFRWWNHIDPVFLILQLHHLSNWNLKLFFVVFWVVFPVMLNDLIKLQISRTVIYVTQFLSLFLSPHWNTVWFVSLLKQTALHNLLFSLSAGELRV